MKPTIVILIAICGAIFYSCQSTEQGPKDSVAVINTYKENKEQNAIVANPEVLNENGLMKKSDCYSCHTNDNKLVGPSFKEIAQKYSSSPDNIKLLVDKVINGGSGVWGQVPMQAHSQMSDNEAQEMINYILALK